jgi:hypothetical protein
MAVTLVVETGAGVATANSYATLVEAETYHEMRLHVENWTTATDPNKEIALMWATRQLDDMIMWVGTRVSETQALRWPREGVVDPDGNEVADDAIPKFLREATCEFARLLIESDREADSDTQGFKEIRAGSLKLVVDKHDRAETMPSAVWSMLMSYGELKRFGARLLDRV